MPEVAYKLLFDYGLSILIVLFTGYMIFRYLNIKLEMMEREFDKKLAERVFKVKGTINHKVLATSNKFEVDLTISEEFEKNQQN